jgi:hypothetical protein
MKVTIELELAEVRELVRLIVLALGGTGVASESPPGSEKR